MRKIWKTRLLIFIALCLLISNISVGLANPQGDTNIIFERNTNLTPLTVEDDELIQTAYMRAKLNSQTTELYFNDYWIKSTLINSNRIKSEPVKRGLNDTKKKKLEWVDVVEGVDISQIVYENRLKEDITVKKKNAPVKFVFKLSYSEGLNAIERGNAIVFTDREGTVLVEIEEPFAIDVEGKYYQYTYSLVGNNLKLEPVSDISDVVYPLVIDPSYTIKVDAFLSASGGRNLVRTKNGDLHAVYFYANGWNKIYYGKSTNDGQTWTETCLTPNVTNDCLRPAIAVDSNDSLHVVWTNYSGGIRYMNYTDQWSGEINISALTSADSAAIAVDSDNNLHVVWDVSNTKVLYRKHNGSVWEDIVAIEELAASFPDESTIAIGLNDYVHVAWRGYTPINPQYQIRYVRYTGSWQSIINLTNESAAQLSPSLICDMSGYVHVVWSGKNATSANKIIRYKKTTAPNVDTWGTTENFTDGSYDQNDPTISATTNNIIHAIWEGQTASSPTYKVIQHIEYDAGWSAISEIISEAGHSVANPESLMSLEPTICGVKTNVPYSGFIATYADGGTAMLYSDADLVWDSSGQYDLTVKARDTETDQYIMNFTGILSTGETKTTDSGVVEYTCLDSGYYEITVSSNEYHSAQQSIVLDQTKEVIVYLTPITETEYFLPQKNLVEFRVQTWRGVPISNVNVTVQGYEITHPQNWLEKLFGYENATEIYSEQMNGTTDSGGSISFLMIATIKYEMVFTKGSEVNETLYIFPKEDHYKIVVGGASWVETESMWDVVNYSILVNEIPGNDTHSYINFSYIDVNSATTEIYYFINQTNGTTSFNIYNHTYTGGDCANVFNSQEVKRGEAYLIGFVGQNDDYGEIKYSILVRIFEKDTRLLEFEDVPDYIYTYTSVGLLMLVAAFFGMVTVPEGSIVICLEGWILWYIGWFLFENPLAPLYLTTATLFAVLIIYAAKGRSKGVS